jgi:hypothetical protein
LRQLLGGMSRPIRINYLKWKCARTCRALNNFSSTSAIVLALAGHGAGLYVREQGQAIRTTLGHRYAGEHRCQQSRPLPSSYSSPVWHSFLGAYDHATHFNLMDQPLTHSKYKIEMSRKPNRMYGHTSACANSDKALQRAQPKSEAILSSVLL